MQFLHIKFCLAVFNILGFPTGRQFVGVTSYQGDKRIPVLLSSHAANLTPIEDGFFARHQLMLGGCKGIDTGEHQDMLESTQVIVEILHQFFQIASHRRRSGFIFLHILIKWLIECCAHDALPHTVGNRHDEAIIVTIRHPLSKGLPAIVSIFSIGHFQASGKGVIFRRFGRNHLSGVTIIVLVIMGQFDATFTRA